MAHYLIYLNREWVGERSEAWIRERAPLAQAAVDEMRAAGVCVYAAGLDDAGTFSVSPADDGTVAFGDGRHAPHAQWLGGFTVIDVEDLAAARRWAARLALACGWPQEVCRLVPELEDAGQGA